MLEPWNRFEAELQFLTLVVVYCLYEKRHYKILFLGKIGEKHVLHQECKCIRSIFLERKRLFQLRITAARCIWVLRATCAKTPATPLPAALRCIWPQFVLTDTGLNWTFKIFSQCTRKIGTKNDISNLLNRNRSLWRNQKQNNRCKVFLHNLIKWNFNLSFEFFPQQKFLA